MRLVVGNKLLLILLLVVFLTKLVIFFLVKEGVVLISLGGGSDADFYHNYAIGYNDTVTSIWNVILRYLNEYELYSRETVSYILLLLNLFFIPILLIKLSNLSFRESQKLFLSAYLITLIYPTLYYYTFDIYRDVFMVFVFLVSCYIVKLCLEISNIFVKVVLFVLSIGLGYFLFELREYLGAAFLGSLFLFRIKFTRKKMVLFGGGYFILLLIINYIGLFETLISYRSGFLENNREGSTLGLDFSNPVMFLPNFILSMLGQLFGLYINNIFSIFLFFVETIPFVIMLRFVYKNIYALNGLGRFLVIFCILYASVWLIGNDNLGTAVRLRMFNYFSIYICFFYLFNKMVYVKKDYS